MKKWVGLISVFLMMILFLLYQGDKENHFTYDSNIMTIYHDDIKTLFGDIKIINQEVKTDSFKSLNLIEKLTYTVWTLEYSTNQGKVNRIQLDNKSDLYSQMLLIINETLSKEIVQSIIPDRIETVINYENLEMDIHNNIDIPLNLYPINIQLNTLPDKLLIVVSPREDMVDLFKDVKDEIIDKIKGNNIKNVLLLEGTDAYQIDYGVFVIDGDVVYENVSVEDAVEWIELNR